MLLNVNRISKTYCLGKSQVPALQDVSFQIDDQEFVVVKGVSGSGKSTLLNILGALEVPSSGDVLLNGQSFGNLSERKRALLRRECIGIVFQSFNLIPVLSALENVIYPLHLSHTQNARHKALQALKDVGLEEFAAHRPTQLSGGQMQRVAIARAVVSQPKLILADEPTANLDSETSRSIMNLMAKLNREKGCTFVIATHHTDVMVYASRMLTMKDGRLIADQSLDVPGSSINHTARSTPELETA